MPRSPSPSRRGDRERPRSRSRSPPRHPKRAKELSFYKKSSSTSYPSRDRDGGEEETARDRAERRERGEVPSRFGGTREQGVRNTMGNVGAATQSGGVGSFKRSTDPLDRMGVRGESGKDRDRDDRSYRDDRRDRDRDRYRDDRRDGERHSHGHRNRERDERRDRDRDRPDPRSIERPSAPTPNAASLGPPERKPAAPTSAPPPAYGRMIEVTANDRMGRKVRVKCMPTDTVGDLKKLIAAQTGTVASKIQLKKWYTNFKDHVSLQDYEINDGMSLEMY